MDQSALKRRARLRRHHRVTQSLVCSPDRPRLSIFRSPRHIYAQVIDDFQGKTLASASTLSPEIRTKKSYGGNVAAAKKVGELIAAKALANGVKKVAFDRGGYQYHGRVKALAEAAREAGLEF